MQELIDLLNSLSEKYKFEEADIKKIQDCIFSIQEGGITNADLEAEDFQTPEGYEVEEAGYVEGDEAE